MFSVARDFRSGLTVIPSILALSVSFALGAIPHVATARSSHAATSKQAFVGNWRLTFETPLGPSQSLLTVMADGTLLFSGQAVKPASEGAPITFISAAHGFWGATGDTTADITWVGMVSDGQGSLLAMVTVSVQAAFGADGNAWDGTYQATVADPQGNVLYEGDGTVQASRIPVPLPASPVATRATE